MSKISLKPNTSGTANFSIEAPATNTDRVFNLPDEAGTVLTNVSDIESQVKTATNATGSAPLYACRAWVNFDGTGTVSIRDSGNVSSITDNGIGDYTVNFTTAMPDVNYSPICSSYACLLNSSRPGQFIGPQGVNINPADPQVNLSTGSVKIGSTRPSTGSNDGSPADSDGVYFAIFR